MMSAQLAQDIFCRFELLNLAGFLVYRFMRVLGIIGSVFNGRRNEAARAPPKSANSHESWRDSFLMLFIKVLAEVGPASHVPGDEIPRMAMKTEMFPASWFRYSMPGFGQVLMKARGIMGLRQEQMVMRNSARLKFQYPEVFCFGELVSESLQEGVQVMLYGSAIRGCFVVGHPEL